ncbi:hypothetical protein F5Y02DRAFT_138743 [Annulohypoxylon stygium]|nr:hypothetical protein F5Y02DRAFT_138743 [Annulohypoxylon stygium]
MSGSFLNKEDIPPSSQPCTVISNAPSQDRSSSSVKSPFPIGCLLDSSLTNDPIIEGHCGKDDSAPRSFFGDEKSPIEGGIDDWEVLSQESVAKNDDNSDSKRTSAQGNTYGPTIPPDTNSAHRASSFFDKIERCGPNPFLLRPVNDDFLSKPESGCLSIFADPKPQVETEKNNHASHWTAPPLVPQSDLQEVIGMMDHLMRDQLELYKRMEKLEAKNKTLADDNATINSPHDSIDLEIEQFIKSTSNALWSDMVKSTIAKTNEEEYGVAAMQSQIDELLREKTEALVKQVLEDELNNTEDAAVSAKKATKTKKQTAAGKKKANRLRAAEEQLEVLHSDVEDLTQAMEDMESEFYDTARDIFGMLSKCEYECRHCPECGLSGLYHM